MAKFIKNFKNNPINSKYMAINIKKLSLAVALLLVLAVLFISSCTVPIEPTANPSNEINPAIKIEQAQNKNLPLKTPAEIQWLTRIEKRAPPRYCAWTERAVQESDAFYVEIKNCTRAYFRHCSEADE